MANIQNLFPAGIAVLFFTAAAIYLFKGDYGRALYFFASMMTGLSAAFFIK